MNYYSNVSYRILPWLNVINYIFSYFFHLAFRKMWWERIFLIHLVKKTQRIIRCWIQLVALWKKNLIFKKAPYFFLFFPNIHSFQERYVWCIFCTRAVVINSLFDNKPWKSLNSYFFNLFQKSNDFIQQNIIMAQKLPILIGNWAIGSGENIPRFRKNADWQKA